MHARMHMFMDKTPEFFFSHGFYSQDFFALNITYIHHNLLLYASNLLLAGSVGQIHVVGCAHTPLGGRLSVLSRAE
jgi:hypothetical protein